MADTQKHTHMKPYTFIVKRTYETIIELEADNYEQALEKLSTTNVYYLEMEQLCVTDEIVETEDGEIVKDINWKY